MLLCPFSPAFLKLTLANPPLDVKRIAYLGARRSSGLARMAACADDGSLLYCPFPMSTKSRKSKRLKKSSTKVQEVAHAELPTRYGRFTIFGFRGRVPQEEAVALVRGNLKGRT